MIVFAFWQLNAGLWRYFEYWPLSHPCASFDTSKVLSKICSPLRKHTYCFTGVCTTVTSQKVVRSTNTPVNKSTGRLSNILWNIKMLQRLAHLEWKRCGKGFSWLGSLLLSTMRHRQHIIELWLWQNYCFERLLQEFGFKNTIVWISDESGRFL